MSIEINSTCGEKFVSIEFNINQYWDDEDLISEIAVNFRAKLDLCDVAYEFLVGFDKDSFIKSISSITEFEKSRAEGYSVLLKGADLNYENDVSLVIAFEEIDSLGHIGCIVKFSRSKRYSNDKEFKFSIADEFQVFPDSILGFVRELRTVANAVK